MKFYVGGRKSLDRMVLELKQMGFKVFGPIRKKGRIMYGELNGTEELPLGKGGISSTTYHSVKELVHPPTQLFLRTDRDYTSYLVMRSNEPLALFGVRPCDLASIRIMDSLLSEDPFYRYRRNAVSWIIVEECLEPGIFCFCSSLGTGPTASEGFDISYAMIGSDCIVFRSGSERGDKLLSSLRLREVSEDSDEVQIYKERAEATADSMKKRFRERLEGVEEPLERSVGDTGLWRRVSEGCLGCSNCNMVCPTCSCTEFVDEAMMDGSAERKRAWVGCLSPVYGQVAGAHFRKDQYMRYRHFVLHKFLYYKKRQEMFACVGCGRCIAFCPMGLDLRSAIQKVFRSYGSK